VALPDLEVAVTAHMASMSMQILETDAFIAAQQVMEVAPTARVEDINMNLAMDNVAIVVPPAMEVVVTAHQAIMSIK
jgi:hypothetical protein